MTLENKIIRDLQVSRSTANALADRQQVHPQVIEILLNRMQTENKVEPTDYAGLIVWKLLPLKTEN